MTLDPAPLLLFTARVIGNSPVRPASVPFDSLNGLLEPPGLRLIDRILCSESTGFSSCRSAALRVVDLLVSELHGSVVRLVSPSRQMAHSAPMGDIPD